MNRIILSVALAIFLQTASFARQDADVTVSGVIRDMANRETLPYATVVLKLESDGEFVAGTVADGDGRFTLSNVNQGTYSVEFSYVGYATVMQSLYVGSLSQFLDLGYIELPEDANSFEELVVTGARDEVNSRMEKRTYTVENNISQSGGSVLQSMQSLPGVTVQDGKVQLRGSDKIAILVDGKQSALTGFNSQTGLDNIPASAIERIEIINNPSASYDAVGNAGIINIIFKKEKEEGFNGKAGMALGAGALWEKRANLPDVGKQYSFTPKINPSLSLNYRKDKTNMYFQGDYLYTERLYKNEFIERQFDDGQFIQQQIRRNRNTGYVTTKLGVDLYISDFDMLTFSGLFGTEKIDDRCDQPFYNKDFSQKFRTWQFYEDELKTTVIFSTAYQHKFPQAGHLLKTGLDYTFRRENEKYYITNILPGGTGYDRFILCADEHVADFNVDYIRPLRSGRIEAGLKFRYRQIPIELEFIPGDNSPMNTDDDGLTIYTETIPALYGIYVYETGSFDVEAGLRLEYVDIWSEVNPKNPTYKNAGFDYFEPFPNVRLTYKFNDRNRISAFYNRRVDRPSEEEIRVFPKFNDPETYKIGNPELKPQFTNSFELGYKTDWRGGYLYMALYDRMTNGTITRISTMVSGRNEIYSIYQNVGRSNVAGVESIFSQKLSTAVSLNVNATVYYNVINAFTVLNKYPVGSVFTSKRTEQTSGNVKFNGIFKLPRQFEAQITAVYLAPDVIPQGKISARFSLDAGVKKTIQNGRGELFMNATDLLNTMKVKNEIQGDGFKYFSEDYYETQVIRVGYTYKF